MLQIAIGWENYHLRAFQLGWDFEDQPQDSLTLAHVARPGFRIGYVYDMGDHWEHVVEVEKAHQGAPGLIYPRVSAGRRAGPPEDCGGPPGYYQVLKALRSRRGPLYREMREGWNTLYDPAAFDKDEINAPLAKLDCSSRL